MVDKTPATRFAAGE